MRFTRHDWCAIAQISSHNSLFENLVIIIIIAVNASLFASDQLTRDNQKKTSKQWAFG